MTPKSLDFKAFFNNCLVFGVFIPLSEQSGVIDLYILITPNTINVILDNMKIIASFSQTLDIHKQLLSNCKLFELRMMLDNEITYHKIEKDLGSIIDNVTHCMYYLVPFDTHLENITGNKNHIILHKIKRNDWETFYKVYQDIINQN